MTYLPIPVGGAALLLFVIERVFFGAPALSEIVVTSVGAWRGEGLALIERIN